MSTFSSRLKRLFINTNKLSFSNTTLYTSRCESTKSIFKNKEFTLYQSPIKKSQSPTSDNYAFLSNPHTFLIRNSNSIQRDKTIEYSNILSRGSMKDLHHEQYKKDLFDNRQKTSRNTRNNQSKTIFNKVDNYTKELKHSITSKKHKTILIPQHLSCATPRNYINQPYHSSIPLCSSKIKNITITRNKKSANPLEWSTYNGINMKPIKKTIYTVASIDLRNLKTSDLTMGTFKNKSNY